jgi:hypothetical protein
MAAAGKAAAIFSRSRRFPAPRPPAAEQDGGKVVAPPGGKAEPDSPPLRPRSLEHHMQSLYERSFRQARAGGAVVA